MVSSVSEGTFLKKGGWDYPVTSASTSKILRYCHHAKKYGFAQKTCHEMKVKMMKTTMVSYGLPQFPLK